MARLAVKTRILSLLVPAALLLGCDQSPVTKTDQALEARLLKLEKALARAEAQGAANAAIAKLAQESAQEIHSLRTLVEIFEGNLNRRGPDFYSLDLDKRDFELVHSNLGPLLVSTENVVPYLDGFKVSLKVGNPHAATYDKLRITASWGNPFTENRRTNNASPKEIQIPQAIVSGAWNRLELTLTPATLEDLKFGELRFAFGGASLTDKRR